ncbi:TPA: restriction endonuclease subunit S [Streptococcus suis]
MRIRVGDISKINELSLLKNDSFDTILYLDTSNLTENKVDTLQKIDLSIDKLPSRAKRKVRKNTILFSNVRPIQRHYGLLEETPNNLIVSTGFTTLNPDDSVIDEYFLYYLLTQDSTINYLQMVAENSVSSYPSITSNDIADLNFVIPDSIEEQKRTVKIIKLIDQKIAINNQINAELEAMAKTLYDYWFVQFDFPDENGKPYKSSGGKMVYNDQLKREIPEGWGVKQLGEICNIFRGSSPRPIDDFIANKGIPWVKISDVTSLKTPFLLTTKDFILPEGKEKSRFLAPGTLILSNSASPGIPKIVQLDCCVHDGWLIIDNIEGNFSKELLYYYFQDLKKNLVNLGNGSIFKNLKTEYVKELLTIIPLEELLISYNSYCKNIFSQILTFEKQNQELTQLRDWLLPMLMNGQVKVD